MAAPAEDRVELRQSRANLLQLVMLIAAVVVAVVVSQLFAPHPSAVVFAVCGGAGVLDVLFAVSLLRNSGATLVVTAHDIVFTRRHGAPQSIQRVDGSILTFRAGRNGPFGSDHTGYVLKLHDNATGKEVYAGAFGRRKVQQACEAHGWSFG